MFGRSWASLSNVPMDRMQKAPPRSYAVMFAGALVMSYVFDLFLIFATTYLYLGAGGTTVALEAAIAATLGFVAPAQLGPVLWEGKSWKLWAINVGYYFVALFLMGVVLSLWQ
jgi:hypothetical protein